MHPAQIKTLCECMGWTIEHTAARLGVNPRTVKEWFDPSYPYPPKPERLQPLLDDWQAFTDDLAQILDSMESLAAAHGDPQAIHLARPYGSTGDDARLAAKARALTILLAVQGFDLAIAYTTPA